MFLGLEFWLLNDKKKKFIARILKSDLNLCQLHRPCHAFAVEDRQDDRRATAVQNFERRSVKRH